VRARLRAAAQPVQKAAGELLRALVFSAARRGVDGGGGSGVSSSGGGDGTTPTPTPTPKTDPSALVDELLRALGDFEVEVAAIERPARHQADFYVAGPTAAAAAAASAAAPPSTTTTTASVRAAAAAAAAAARQEASRRVYGCSRVRRALLESAEWWCWRSSSSSSGEAGAPRSRCWSPRAWLPRLGAAAASLDALAEVLVEDDDGGAEAAFYAPEIDLSRGRAESYYRLAPLPRTMVLRHQLRLCAARDTAVPALMAASGGGSGVASAPPLQPQAAAERRVEGCAAAMDAIAADVRGAPTPLLLLLREQGAMVERALRDAGLPAAEVWALREPVAAAGRVGAPKAPPAAAASSSILASCPPGSVLLSSAALVELWEEEEEEQDEQQGAEREEEAQGGAPPPPPHPRPGAAEFACGGRLARFAGLVDLSRAAAEVLLLRTERALGDADAAAEGRTGGDGDSEQQQLLREQAAWLRAALAPTLEQDGGSGDAQGVLLRPFITAPCAVEDVLVMPPSAAEAPPRPPPPLSSSSSSSSSSAPPPVPDRSPSDHLYALRLTRDAVLLLTQHHADAGVRRAARASGLRKRARSALAVAAGPLADARAALAAARGYGGGSEGEEGVGEDASAMAAALDAALPATPAAADALLRDLARGVVPVAREALAEMAWLAAPGGRRRGSSAARPPPLAAWDRDWAAAALAAEAASGDDAEASAGRRRLAGGSAAAARGRATWQRDFAPFFSLPGLVEQGLPRLVGAAFPGVLRLELVEEAKERGGAAGGAAGDGTGAPPGSWRRRRALAVWWRPAVERPWVLAGHVLVEVTPPGGFPFTSLLRLGGGGIGGGASAAAAAAAEGEGAAGQQQQAPPTPPPSSLPLAVMRLPLDAYDAETEDEDEDGQGGGEALLRGPFGLRALLHETGHALQLVLAARRATAAPETTAESVPSTSGAAPSSPPSPIPGAQHHPSLGAHAAGLDARELAAHFAERLACCPPALALLSGARRRRGGGEAVAAAGRSGVTMLPRDALACARYVWASGAMHSALDLLAAVAGARADLALAGAAAADGAGGGGDDSDSDRHHRRQEAYLDAWEETMGLMEDGEVEDDDDEEQEEEGGASGGARNTREKQKQRSRGWAEASAEALRAAEALAVVSGARWAYSVARLQAAAAWRQWRAPWDGGGPREAREAVARALGAATAGAAPAPALHRAALLLPTARAGEGAVVRRRRRRRQASAAEAEASTTATAALPPLTLEHDVYQDIDLLG
jgi:hypothetical protein